MSTPQRGTVLYVSKFPPSRSGVALYASVFEKVLQRLTPVRRLAAPSDPEISQSLRQALRGLLLGFRLDLSSIDRVHVELSGRALFEFYFCLGLTARPSSRTPLDITCHDSPSVAGATVLFRELDRPRLRRFGMVMSGIIGRRLEHRVMRRASTVWALTKAGAEALQLQYHVPVYDMPHVVDEKPGIVKHRHIFVPGPLADAAPLVAVITRMSSQWPLVIGHCTSDVEEAVRTAVAGRFPLSFTGFLDEQRLLEQFASAAVVLRVRGSLDSGNKLAASGPLSWAVSRGCLCITDDSRAGALELAHLRLVSRPDNLPVALDAAVRSFTDKKASAIASQAREVMGIEAVSTLRAAVISRQRAPAVPGGEANDM